MAGLVLYDEKTCSTNVLKLNANSKQRHAGAISDIHEATGICMFKTGDCKSFVVRNSDTKDSTSSSKSSETNIMHT